MFKITYRKKMALIMLSLVVKFSLLGAFFQQKYILMRQSQWFIESSYGIDKFFGIKGLLKLLHLIKEWCKYFNELLTKAWYVDLFCWDVSIPIMIKPVKDLWECGKLPVLYHLFCALTGENLVGVLMSFHVLFYGSCHLFVCAEHCSLV